MTSTVAEPPGRRRAILEATLRVIGERGLDAVTHRSAAAEAGVALGAMTYYFSSKADLVERALAHAAATEIERIDERAGELGGDLRSPGRWASAFVDWLAEQIEGEGRALLVAQYELQLQAAHRPELRRICRDWNAANRRLAERMLTGAGSPDPANDARVLIAAVDGLRLYELSAAPGLERQAMQAAITRLLEALTGRR
ncbi:MAG: TetR family transcriptional regulator [Thermoleophilaceae bacterium]